MVSLSPVEGFGVFPSHLLHVYKFVMVLHLRKSCREMTTFTAGVKMEMLSGTPTLSRPDTGAVKLNRGQSGDKDAL